MGMYSATHNHPGEGFWRIYTPPGFHIFIKETNKSVAKFLTWIYSCNKCFFNKVIKQNKKQQYNLRVNQNVVCN